ncbi:MAG: IS30 family transposase [Pseudomonadota bacterium]
MRPRIYYSAEQRAEIWDRWKRGESMHEIGRAFDRGHSSIQKILMATGGIRPAVRKRSRLALSLAEREEISRGLVAGFSLRLIADRLKRAPSTISREVNRNGGRRGYRAVKADKRAWEQALRPKVCKLVLNDRLRQAVIRKLKRFWSPQQIAGWLRREYANSKAMNVSHETIYRSLYVQARGALKKELIAYLRQKRIIRRSRYARQPTDKRGQIKGAVSISERPASVEDRAVPGHWEGDLLCGSNNSFIATLVERHTRFVMLAKLPSRHTEAVVDALIKQSRRLPTELYKSLTWDRGHEMADHKRFSMETKIDVYFCDPKSPWQRGTNENTNRLLRQFLPKGTDLSKHSQAQLNKIARLLNERPRKTLDYHSPAERLKECVASIG